MKITSQNRLVTSKKLALARKIVLQLRKKLGKNLVAAAVCGSVARGTAEVYSDIDLLVLIRKLPVHMARYEIVNGTYCSVNYLTWSQAISQLTHPAAEMPSIVGGYSRTVAIYDPARLFRSLEAKASKVPREIFRQSAELALNYSFEDFCRAKNAFLRGDEIVLKDNVFLVTNSAANVVASLNNTSYVSDREIFKAYKRFVTLPRNFERIEKLRYGNLKGRALFSMLLEFYIDLIAFCRDEGVLFPVKEKDLRNLG